MSSSPDLKQRRVSQDLVDPECESDTDADDDLPHKRRTRHHRLVSSWLSLIGVFFVLFMVLYHATQIQHFWGQLEDNENLVHTSSMVKDTNQRYVAIEGNWHERSWREQKRESVMKAAIGGSKISEGAFKRERRQSESGEKKQEQRTIEKTELSKTLLAAKQVEASKNRVKGAKNGGVKKPDNRGAIPQQRRVVDQKATDKMASKDGLSVQTKTALTEKGVKEPVPKQIKGHETHNVDKHHQTKEGKVATQHQALKQKREELTSIEKNTPSPTEKCTPWEISLDDWWQDNPTWEPSFENDTHACFQLIQNPERVELLQKAHSLQFNGCQKKPAIRHLFPMGYAATLLFHLNSGFWSAFREERQFLPGIAHEGFKWLYQPSDHNSWAHCPTHDHECLFLPISNCPRPVGGKEENPKKKYQFRELVQNETLVERNIWLSHYLMRPRQVFRKKLYEFLRDSQDIMPKVQTPCTWIHVRRADAMTEANYKRNYYLLKEYLTRGDVKKDDNILLLTDDQSTIEEAELLHPEYNWHYWDRKRHRGPVHNNAHIPSGDQAYEILTIMAERKLASQCQKGVFGKSNMATLFRNAMAIEHPGGLTNLTLVEIDRRALKKNRIEPEDFVKELDKQLDEARKTKAK